MAASRQITVKGTCHHDCPDSCGWLVTVRDGVAVRLRGNPEHPYSRGELCPKVNRFLERVYSPDRLLVPLVRTGPKGSGSFEPASWDDALGLVVERVGEAIDRHGGETILPWSSAGTQGVVQCTSLDRRFFAKLGASRPVGSLCGATAGAGVAATLGSGLASDPLDVVHAEVVVLWATNTRLTNRHYWPYVERARAGGATVVVIDPYRTVTADAADRHLRPRPGTDVALMLAMMHVLVRDGLVDDDYVTRHTTGFGDLVAHVAGWPPERAAAETGIDADDIEWLATSYGRAKPAMIRTLIGAEHHTNGAMFFRTLACLPTITGSWRRRGGGLARSVGAWSAVDVEDPAADAERYAAGRARRSLEVVHLGRILTDASLAPPVSALFVWNGNPMVSAPRADLVRTGLARDDLFTVVSEQFLTDTARYADVVFPATTQIEQTDAVASWGHLWLGWNERAIEPLGEAVPNTEWFRRLAAAFGFDEPGLHESDDELLTRALPAVDRDAIRRDGFVRLSVPDPLLPYADGGFATPDGRAALRSEALEHIGQPTLPTHRQPQVDVDPVAFPLTLHTPKVHPRFLNSSYSHLPGHGDAEGAPWCQVSAADAAARGIADGDLVEVRSPSGVLHLTATVSDRVSPGLVAVPWGWWSRDHGADGATVNALTVDVDADWGGGVAYGDTRVEVARVD